MSKRTGSTILLLLLIFMISNAPAYTQARKPVRSGKTQPRAPFLLQVKEYQESPSVTKVVLKNGMKVVVNEYNAQPVISIQLHIDAGSLNDPVHDPGLSRLLAAMICRGPADNSSGTYKQNIQALGGIVRSHVDYRTTMYEIIAPSTQWKRALGLQATALLNPSFKEEDLKLESDLLRSEMQGMKDSAAFAEGKLLELGFNQPGMQLSYGIDQTPATITREAIDRFHKKMYVPERMMLVISGDINASEVLNEVVRIYAKPSVAIEKTPSVSLENRQHGFRYGMVRGAVPFPRLLIGFHAVPAKSEEYHVLEVLSALLGSGDASILSARLKQQKKLIYSAETKLSDCPDLGYLSIIVETDEKNIDRSELAVLTELELLKRDEPSDVEMERALAQLEQAYWKRMETVTGRAKNLAFFEGLGNWKLSENYLAELRKVKPSDIALVAGKYLRLENCSLLEYLPSSIEERSLTTESVFRTLDGLLAPATDQEQEERRKETILAMTIPKDAGPFMPNGIRYQFQIASILRGPEISIREDHTSPLIEMGFYFPGGKLDENESNCGITKLLLHTILGSAQGKNSVRFYRQMEVYGGHIHPVVADDYFGFYFSIPSRNFDAGFNLFQEAIKTPNFDKDIIAREKEMQLWGILEDSYSDLYGDELLRKALFKNFPYALNSNGTEASLAQITPDALQRWYESHVKNRKPVVTIIGDTKGTNLSSYFVRHFSGSRMQENTISEKYARPLEKGEVIDQIRPGKKTLILVGFQAPPEDDEDGYTVSVLQGYSGNAGRFIQALRDRLGVVYDVSVDYKPLLRGGILYLRAAANPDDTDKALKAIRDEIQKLNTVPVSYRDFLSGLNSAASFYEIKNESRAAQMDTMTRNVLAGKGIEGYLKYHAGLENVKEEAFDEFITKIFNIEKAVIIVVRGKMQ